MPSPFGHALAGVTAAWTADLLPGDRAWRTAPASARWYKRAGNGLTLACAALGAAADLDFLFGVHRTVTHSIAAVAVVALIAAALAARANRPVARVVAMCAAAYATHLLLDWLGSDAYPPFGIQALWPFSHQWYISDTDLFRQTARQEFFSAASIIKNLQAIVQEMAILGPTAVGVWLVRVKALSGLSSEMTRGDHSAQ
jgi:inner membrane protein